MIQVRSLCKRERFAFPLAFSALLGIILSLVLIFTEKIVAGAFLLLLCLYVLKLAIGWFFNLERHFEFDSESGVVNQITKENKKVTTVQIANSSDIQTFAVAGIRNWARHGHWWTYHVLMILKDGKIYNITNPAGDKKHHEVKKKAQEFAQSMGCECFDSVHEQALEIKKLPGHVEVSNRPWEFIDTFRFQGRDILYAVSFFIAILIFIVAMTVSLS